MTKLQIMQLKFSWGLDLFMDLSIKPKLLMKKKHLWIKQLMYSFTIHLFRLRHFQIIEVLVTTPGQIMYACGKISYVSLDTKNRCIQILGRFELTIRVIALRKTFTCFTVMLVTKY